MPGFAVLLSCPVLLEEAASGRHSPQPSHRTGFSSHLLHLQRSPIYHWDPFVEPWHLGEPSLSLVNLTCYAREPASRPQQKYAIPVRLNCTLAPVRDAARSIEQPPGHGP